MIFFQKYLTERMVTVITITNTKKGGIMAKTIQITFDDKTHHEMRKCIFEKKTNNSTFIIESVQEKIKRERKK